MVETPVTENCCVSDSEILTDISEEGWSTNVSSDSSPSSRTHTDFSPNSSSVTWQENAFVMPEETRTTQGNKVPGYIYT